VLTEELLKTLVEHQNTALILLNNELIIQYLNPAAESALQLSTSRSTQLPLTQCCTPPLELLERIQAEYINKRAFVLRESQWIIAGHALCLDIIVTPIDSSLSAFTSDSATTRNSANTRESKNKQTQGMHAKVELSTTEDYFLLELHLIDRILKISKEEHIAEHHKASRALIRGLAHEVKNPLGAIRAATQLLARRIDTENQEYTELIIAEVDRLTSLVDSMLGPHTPLVISQINIHQVLERVIRLVELEERLHQTIIIERLYDLSLPEINGDADRLIQAFLNLMTNAKQALNAQSGAHPAKISIHTKIARQVTLHHRLHRLALHILIEDNGPGIPAELKESLFYPLVSGRADGTGIGLSIAQHILQQHGGMIECESVSGCTQFHCFIPVDLPLMQSFSQQGVSHGTAYLDY